MGSWVQNGLSFVKRNAGERKTKWYWKSHLARLGITMQKRLRVIVTGRVQGVGFRYFVLARGEDLGVKGWTRNLGEDSVEAVAEAEEGVLDSFLEKIKYGPPAGKVDRVEVSWEKATGEFHSFHIKPSA